LNLEKNWFLFGCVTCTAIVKRSTRRRTSSSESSTLA
jgi:hypothetical protein